MIERLNYVGLKYAGLNKSGRKLVEPTEIDVAFWSSKILACDRQNFILNNVVLPSGVYNLKPFCLA